MNIAVATLVGIVASLLAVRVLAPVLRLPTMQRTNYRGHQLPTAGGIVAVAAALATMLCVGASRAVTGRTSATARLPIVLLVFVGFAMLGLVDDLAGNSADRGFGGHLLALRHGRLTTGGVKLLGGAAIALIAADALVGGAARMLVAAGVIALGANLANLFDRAPGRLVKVGAIVWMPLAIAAIVGCARYDDDRVAVTACAVCIGSCLGLAPSDAGERLMLGDTGANALGAVLGLVVVLAMSTAVQVGVLIAVALLNLSSEFVSFSVVIDRIGWLRRLDRFGTRR